MRSHTELTCTYRDIAVGKAPQITNFLLTPENFIQELSKSYGPSAQETCNKESEVFKELKNAINGIGNTSKRISEALKNWQTANLKTESEAEISERERKEEEGNPSIKRAGLVENSSEAVVRVNTTSTPKEGGDGISGWLRNAGARIANAFEDMK